MIGVAGFMLYPLVATVLLSLQSGGRYVGFDNYARLFAEPRFFGNLGVTALYLAAVVVLTMVLGFLAAHLITKPGRATSVLRPLYLIPWIIPNVASAILFRSMLDGAGGPVPAFIEKLTGIAFLPLADYTWTLWFVVLHDVWRNFPFAMLFIAAGLATIHPSIYEAARLDGAGRLAQAFQVTIPMLRSHLFVVTLMVTNFALQSAETIYSMTQGGPGTSTETLGVRVFKSGFVYGQVNEGAVLGVIMLVIAVALMVVYQRLLNVREENFHE